MKIKKLKDVKISKRLISGFLAVSCILAFVSAYGIFSLLREKNEMSDLYGSRMVSMPYLTKILVSLSSVQAFSRDAVINQADSEKRKSDLAAVESSLKEFQTYDAKLAATIDSPEWKTKIKAARAQFDGVFEPDMKEIGQDLQAGRLPAAGTLLNESLRVHDQIQSAYEAYMTALLQEAAAADAENARSTTAALFLLLAFSAVGIAASIVLGITISRSVGRPLRELEEVARQFADGTLSVRVRYASQNEIGSVAESLNFAFSRISRVVQQTSELLVGIAKGECSYGTVRNYEGDFRLISDALNTILDNLNRIFVRIRSSAEQVDSGSRQIADGAQELAQGATEQASSVEQLSASISEVSQNVESNVRQIDQMAKKMDAAAREAAEGNTEMEQMLAAMNAMEKASEEIGKIIKVIDSIAFQTNILALNAAVEAARAGEAGKGFAVVADEVRSLAGKSAEAAKQTTALIGNSIERVREGQKLSDSTARSLSRIAGAVNGLDQAVRNIKRSSDAQAASIAQITQGVGRVSSVVQTNSATAEESAAASEELSAQADALKKEIAWVRLRQSPEQA